MMKTIGTVGWVAASVLVAILLTIDCWQFAGTYLWTGFLLVAALAAVLIWL
jgi:hypothetical protein